MQMQFEIDWFKNFQKSFHSEFSGLPHNDEPIKCGRHERAKPSRHPSF